MNDLMEGLRKFIDAGDEQRYYQLRFDEVRWLIHEIEQLRSREVKILSFADIRDEFKRREAEKAERLAELNRNVS